MQQNKKRLFLGWEVRAPWPEHFPFGRLLDEDHRHLTLAFLGATNDLKLMQELSQFPLSPWTIGPTGYFDQCLFLPEKHPRVAAWHIKWWDNGELVNQFHKTVIQWLHNRGFCPDSRHSFMPHVTLARSPFHPQAWLNHFSPLPCIIKDLHLYESVGNLNYRPLWSLPIPPAFEEIEHTADLAYFVRGVSYYQLYLHGACALAFHFPSLLPFIYSNNLNIDSLEEVVMELNRIILRADQEVGSPFKAVSYHSQLEINNGCMMWEMIVDV